MLSYILLMPLVFLLALTLLRWLYTNIIYFQLNKSARKKRKQGQTFKEWLFYSRYRKEIPRVLIYLYFVFIIVNLIIFIVALIFYFFQNIDYIYCIFVAIVCFDYGLTLILDIAFYGRRKNGQTYIKVERWIKKKKRK